MASGDEVAEVVRWAEGIERVHECIAGRFRRPEPRRRALEYWRSLLSPVERKNGWHWRSRRATPLPTGCSACCPVTVGMTVWFVMTPVFTGAGSEKLRAGALGRFRGGGAGGGRNRLSPFSRGQALKKGAKSVGVQRQYSGTGGRIENCQIGVFLAYAGARGRTLLDRELYLPQAWAEDRERRREAGVPEEVSFETKPRLAREMLERALEAGVPFAWVTGDVVYGSDRRLRMWLEQEGMSHVLAVKSNEKLWVWQEEGPRQVRADRLAALVDESGWQRRSAGDGAKGPRVYDWARVEMRSLKEPGKGYWLLVRRSLAKPGELAYYVCFGPSCTALEELVRVAGVRWAIEECFEEAKGQVGLDQYEVRRWDGWYRHITLAMLALAYLAVTRYRAAADQGGSYEKRAARNGRKD